MSLWKATARGVGYPLAVLLAIVFLPITAGVAVATNYRGAAEQVDDIPGVDPDGGVQSGMIVGGLLVGLVLGTGAVGAFATGGGEDTTNGSTGTFTSRSPTPTAEVGTDFAPLTAEEESKFSTETPTDSNRTLEQVRWFSATYIEVLENNSGISVTNWSSNKDVLNITYQQDSSDNRTELSENIAAVIGVYNSAVENLNVEKPSRLTAYVENESGNVELYYYIKTEWSRSVITDNMSREVQGDKVSKTVTRIEDR